MLKQQHFDSPPSQDVKADVVSLARRRREVSLEEQAGNGGTAEVELIARDQLAREIADIESAIKSLRRAEPALESWTATPAAVVHKPRPVWLLIGMLWLSTALITAGIIVALAVLAG